MCFDSSTGKVIAPAAEQLVSYSCVPATYFAELLRLYLHAPAPGHGGPVRNWLAALRASPSPSPGAPDRNARLPG